MRHDIHIITLLSFALIPIS